MIFKVLSGDGEKSCPRYLYIMYTSSFDTLSARKNRQKNIIYINHVKYFVGILSSFLSLFVFYRMVFFRNHYYHIYCVIIKSSRGAVNPE